MQLATGTRLLGIGKLTRLYIQKIMRPVQVLGQQLSVFKKSVRPLQVLGQQLSVFKKSVRPLQVLPTHLFLKNLLRCLRRDSALGMLFCA
jgi:hypothetical protein